jgi:hypothetical protein
MACRLPMGLNFLPFQMVLEDFPPGDKEASAWSWPLSSVLFLGQVCWRCTSTPPPTCFHDMMPNYVSTGATAMHKPCFLVSAARSMQRVWAEGSFSLTGVSEKAKHEVINARMWGILSTSVREKRPLSAGISRTTLVYTPVYEAAIWRWQVVSPHLTTVPACRTTSVSHWPI